MGLCRGDDSLDESVLPIAVVEVGREPGLRVEHMEAVVFKGRVVRIDHWDA